MAQNETEGQRVYLYAGYSDAPQKAKFKKLEKLGYIANLKKVKQYPPEYRTHKLKCPGCSATNKHTVKRIGRRKANCDSELTLDVINDGVRKKYAGIIVFSGDGDFSRMYEYVAEELVKPVVVFSPMGSVAGSRTSTRVKDLHKKGIIRIDALEGILGYKGYGIK